MFQKGNANVLETLRKSLQNVDGTVPKRFGNIPKIFWKGNAPRPQA